MIVLSCKDLHKSYGIEIILNNITFSINEGEKVGLIGANGAGKSTLFKILTGQLEFDSGDVFIDKNKTIGYLSQQLSLNSENTIFQEMLSVFSQILDMENKLCELEKIMNEPYDINKEEYHNKVIREYTNLNELYNNIGGYTYKGDICRVLNGLGFTEADYEKEISLLSGGQKTRVALCKLLLTNPDILLLDEPTNHLDLAAIEWLEEYLKSYKGTVVLISHDRFFLDSITSVTVEIIGGRADYYSGNYSSYIDLKKKAHETQMKAYSLQQAEIKRQEEIIERFRSFNREKSIKAAESRQKALDKVERIDAPDKEVKITKMKFQTAIKSGNDVLHIENLEKSYGEKHLFSNLNLDIKSGEKLALIGENGRGKTTLFKIILEKISEYNGLCVLGKNVICGYYDQEQSDLNLEKTVIDEVWDDFPNLTTTEVRTALAAFLFTKDDVFKKVKTLSGGEKCRINLLKLMLSQSNFLLLDEPTNHLDIPSREALEDAILSYDGTVMVISHDRYFLNKVIDKIYELNENGLITYLGNYSYYIEKKKNPHRYAIIEENLGKTKTQIQAEKKKKREVEKAEKIKKGRVKEVENEIATLEGNLLSLQEELCLEEVYSNPEKCEEVNKTIQELNEKIALLYEEWEELL